MAFSAMTSRASPTAASTKMYSTLKKNVYMLRSLLCYSCHPYPHAKRSAWGTDDARVSRHLVVHLMTVILSSAHFLPSYSSFLPRLKFQSERFLVNVTRLNKEQRIYLLIILLIRDVV